MDKKTIDTYNKLAKEYDLETLDFWKRFPSSIIRTFVKNTLKSGGKVLDIGSGPGRDGVLLKSGGLDVTCLDASSSMLDICKNRGLKIAKADFLNIPFEDGSFNGVWAYTSLLHVRKSDIDKVFQEIKRILKDDGTLGLGLIEGEDELYRYSLGINKPRWFAFYKKEEVDKILKNHGFKLVYFNHFKPGSKGYLNYIAVRLP